MFRDEDGNITAKVGDPISWGTMSGEMLEGVIQELDSNVAIVKLPDGETTSVEL